MEKQIPEVRLMGGKHTERIICSLTSQATSTCTDTLPENKSFRVIAHDNWERHLLMMMIQMEQNFQSTPAQSLFKYSVCARQEVKWKAESQLFIALTQMDANIPDPRAC